VALGNRLSCAIALVGRQDTPTDALRDYCKHLGDAFSLRGIELEIVDVPWAADGWLPALWQLWQRAGSWRGKWVLSQYTALAWSQKGFPIGFMVVQLLLRLRHVRSAVVFHDPNPFGGERLRDRLRHHIQMAVLRQTSRIADKVVTTVSVGYVNWMKSSAIRAKVLFVPVGSNLTTSTSENRLTKEGIPVVIIFGFSQLQAESELIASVLMRSAKRIGPIHLIIFGRGAMIVEALLEPMLQESLVSLEAYGIVESEHASLLFARANVQVFIRSGLSSRRGSGIAGIACGVPIVGFSDAETAFPVTEAGVRLVPIGDVEGLVRELVLVLQQPMLQEALRRRSLEAAQLYFSWDCIAAAYVSALTGL
jgi:glycosyltransferase involved in cell wall biosynthesis